MDGYRLKIELLIEAPSLRSAETRLNQLLADALNRDWVDRVHDPDGRGQRAADPAGP